MARTIRLEIEVDDTDPRYNNDADQLAQHIGAELDLKVTLIEDEVTPMI